MPKNPEKYEANHDGNGSQEASDSSKKTAKVVAKGAADYFTGGKGGAIVDKVADSKLGNAILNKAGKEIDKNPLLKKAAEKLDDSGTLDAADQGLSMVEGGKNGASPSLGNSNSNLPGLGESGEKSKSSSMDISSNSSDDNSTTGSVDFIGSGKLAGIGSLKLKLGLLGGGFLLIFFFGFVAIISGTDEEGTDPKDKHGSIYEDSCVTDNLQADELCQLHNQNKYEEWINLFGPIAQKDYSRTGVFASITLAQAIIESAWACSDIQNNLFGIKCHGYATCTSVNTHEEYNGQSVSIVDSFRTYPSVANSIEDHSNFLKSNSIYSQAGVFSARNYEEQARALKLAGYATASNYASSLINLINTYNLSRFDVVVNTSSSAKCENSLTESINGWNIRTTEPTPNDKAFTYVSSNRGQCVWYAQARAVEIVEDLLSKGKLSAENANAIKEKLLRAYGNGGDWYDNTRGVFKGSNNIKDIKAGSLISWKKPGGYGHVAVIEDVSDEKVTITEGWATATASCPSSWNCVNFKSRTVSLDDFYNSFGKYYTGAYRFSGYIYFMELEG